MISDAVISIILGIVTFLVNLFPAGNISFDSIDPFINAASGVNFFIDVPALISVVGIVISFELTMMTVRGLIFLWRLIKP